MMKRLLVAALLVAYTSAASAHFFHKVLPIPVPPPAQPVVAVAASSNGLALFPFFAVLGMLGYAIYKTEQRDKAEAAKKDHAK
jgi:hypothetical protein